MAWYAEYLRCLRYKKHSYYHWIKWYKKYLYDVWFASLTPEQQAEIKRRKEIDEKRAKILLNVLMSAYTMYNDI